MENTASKEQKEENDEKIYTNERMNTVLKLRKKKNNSIISKMRGIYEGINEETLKQYQIQITELNINEELKVKKYDDYEDFLKEIKKYFKSDDIEYNKYAIHCLCGQTINKDTLKNRDIFIDTIIKGDYISDILFLIQKYLNDKKIVYEGLWTIINILYYSKENADISLFLAKDVCIQLYIKILDLKDKTINPNVYWLLVNLVNNSSFGLTNKILLSLYMSPLLRLYLIPPLTNNMNNLTKDEIYYLLTILSRFSDFITDTIICLNKNDISMFTNYNSNVDYNSIKENNDFLFYNLMNIFINAIYIKNVTSCCIYGLSRLTNYLDDSKICNQFFISGICRKLVRNEIETESDFLPYTIQIIGNYLSFIDDNMIDKIFIEETLAFFVKIIQNNPGKQNLKRDIYWSTSNITSGNVVSNESFAKSGLLNLVLQSLYSDNDLVIHEALCILGGFFDAQNINVIINFYYLDYMKNLYLCLKNFHDTHSDISEYSSGGILDKLINCIGFLFEDGDLFKNDMIQNKFVKDFEQNGGFELLELISSEHKLNNEIQKSIDILLDYQKK